MTLDRKLILWDHLRGAVNKASKSVAAHSRIMLNLREQKPAKPILLTVSSIILYWAEL